MDDLRENGENLVECVCVFVASAERKKRGGGDGEMTSMDTWRILHGYMMYKMEVTPPKVNPPLISFFCFIHGPRFWAKKKGWSSLGPLTLVRIFGS